MSSCPVPCDRYLTDLPSTRPPAMPPASKDVRGAGDLQLTTTNIMSGPTPTIPMSDIDNEVWNERSERRTEILCRLEAVLREKLNRHCVPPAFWAFCHVADISKLERMISLGEGAQNTEIAALLLEPTIKDCDLVLSRCIFLAHLAHPESLLELTSHQGSRIPV